MQPVDPPPADRGEGPTSPEDRSAPAHHGFARRPTTSIFGFEPVDITREVLLDTRLVRATIGLVLGVVILVWPRRSDGVLAALAGVTIVVISTLILIEAIRHHRSRERAVSAVLGVLAGGSLVVNVASAPTRLGIILGLSLIVVAIRRRPRRHHERRLERLAMSIALATVGLLAVAFPEPVLAATTSFILVGWIVLSAVTVGVALDARTDELATYGNAARTIVAWFNELSDSYPGRDELADRLTYVGLGSRQRVVRFYVLMTFAAVIAAMGVITDSTAVVIGAMLIAPLMTPLMGMAMSLAMGWPHRLGRAGLIAFGGVVLAILVGVVLGLISPTVVNTATNSQIVARSEPNILDLIIAVAAGGAGAYGLSRSDVSDALPGVAIAIALVPPLAVAGIAYSAGDAGSGNGALLLFGTNAVAILLVGGITFVFTGVVPLSTIADNQRRVTTALAAVVTLAAMVVGGLLLNGQQATTALLRRGRTETVVDDWLGVSDQHRVQAISTDGDLVIVDILGPRIGVPDVDVLAADLSEAFGRDMQAEVRLTVEQIYTSATTPATTTPAG